MPAPIQDVAHLGPVQLLTPEPEKSRSFFVDVLGMEVEGEEGDSVFLRGWGTYQRFDLELTASATSGLGYMGCRAWSQEALERRVAAIEASGLGVGWSDGARGRGPSYRFADPDGHSMEIYYETERYVPPPGLQPALRNQPQRYTARGAAVKRLDHEIGRAHV